MQGLRVGDIVDWLEQLAPTSLAESWDRVGLQCGRADAKVTKIVTALTLTSGVIDEAVAQGAQLIVTHHPLIFHPLTSLSPDTRVGSLLYQLVKKDLALVVAHTNLDKTAPGVNDGLARRLQLVKTTPLIPDSQPVNPTCKLVTFVPAEAEENVRNALADAGAGVIGRYTHCAFAIKGSGSFLPMDDASPYSGSAGELSRVDEIRLETVVDRIHLKKAVAALDAAHPYEEVAVDIYPLEAPRPPRVGLGRVGDLTEAMEVRRFIGHVKNCLGLSDYRLAGNVNQKIHRVAVIGGSGGGFVKQAHAAGADALITGDVDYHEADEAAHLGILLMDAGHFGTEKHVPHDLATHFSNKAASQGNSLEVVVYDEADVFISLE